MIAANGMELALSSSRGRMLAATLASPIGGGALSKLASDRVQSSLATIKVRARRSSHQTGERPKSGGLRPEPMLPIPEGRSYRWIAHDRGISGGAIRDIVHGF